MADKSTMSFQLPDGKTLDVYAVKLPDGRIVVRSREELERAPAPSAPSPRPDGGR